MTKSGAKGEWPHSGMLLATLVLGVVLLSACQSGRENSESQGPGPFQGREVYRFQALPEMVATSDVVVVGTVRSVESRAVGPQEEEIQYLDATVGVESVLKGSMSDPMVTVSTRELSYSPPHVDWRQPGQRVLAFLSRTRGDQAAGRYHPVNQSQSMFALSGNTLRATVSDPLARQIGAMTLPVVVSEVENAKAAIARGEVNPQPARGRA